MPHLRDIILVLPWKLNLLKVNCKLILITQMPFQLLLSNGKTITPPSGRSLLSPLTPLCRATTGGETDSRLFMSYHL